MKNTTNANTTTNATPVLWTDGSFFLLLWPGDEIPRWPGNPPGYQWRPATEEEVKKYGDG